jgi:hypothetical protein
MPLTRDEAINRIAGGVLGGATPRFVFPYGPDVVRKVLVEVSADYYFAVLTRSDDWYLQVGYGLQAGTRSGWYALERRDGALDQHYRAEVTDLEEVVRAFVGFTQDDPTIVHRFPWRTYSV